MKPRHWRPRLTRQPLPTSPLPIAATTSQWPATLTAGRRVCALLDQRGGARPYDYAADSSGELRVVLHVVDDPEEAAEALSERLAHLDQIGGSHQWKDLLHAATVAAGRAEPQRTLDELAKCDVAARDTHNDDGLPDLLVPLALIAWKTGDVEHAKLLLTAIRRAPRPTQAFPITIVYRQLRDRLGLLNTNPLESAMIEAVYEEAIEWLKSLI